MIGRKIRDCDSNRFKVRDAQSTPEGGRIARPPIVVDVVRISGDSSLPMRTNIAGAIGTTHTITQPQPDVLIVVKTLSGSYVVFTSTSRSCGQSIAH